MVLKRTCVSPQYLRKEQIHVSILEIKSPSHFIIREAPSLSKSSDAQSFAEAEAMMQKYYRSLESEFQKMPLQDSIVVVKQKDRFYRAKVCSILNASDSYIFRVFLLDYGKECTVRREHLYEIQEDFSTYSYQAVELKLLDVEPISLDFNAKECKVEYGPVSSWDPSAMTFIQNMFKDMNNAHVEIKAVGDHFVFGNLYITSSTSNIHDKFCVNEVLKERKFARLKDDFWGDVILIDKFLEKIGNPNNNPPDVQSSDKSPGKLQEYTSTPTSSRKPETHPTISSPPPSIISSPSPSNPSLGKLQKLKMLKRRSSSGQPNSESSSPVATEQGSPGIPTSPVKSEIGSTVAASAKSDKLQKLKMLKRSSSGQPNSESSSPVPTEQGFPGVSTVKSESVDGPTVAASANKFQKLKMLKRKSSSSQPNAVNSSPVSASSNSPITVTSPLQSESLDESSEFASESESKLEENETAKNTPNRISGQNNLQKLLKLRKSKISCSPQKPPDSSTPLNSHDLLKSPPAVLPQSSLTRGSVIDGISPIPGAKLEAGSPAVELSSLKEETDSLNMAFMNSTQPKDVKKNADTSDTEKTSSIGEKTPTLKPTSKLAKLKSLRKNTNPTSPKPDAPKTETTTISSPTQETMQRSGSLPKFDDEFLADISNGAADDLDCVLNPRRGSVGYSEISSPECSRHSSISSDSITDRLQVNSIDFNDKSLWEKQKVPALCIGEAIPSPMLSTGEASFPADLKKTLKQLSFLGPSCIQTVVWPAVDRGRCLAAIAPPNTGKTVAYLLPLVASFIVPVTHTKLPKTNGPIVIIVCSSWKKVHAVHDLFKLFLSGAKCKILCFFSGGHKRNKVSAMLSGCDVVISVPSCLINFFKEGVLCLKRCCNFILDDGSTLLSQNMKEMKEVMRHFTKGIELRCSMPISLQMMLCAERWSKAVASFVDKFMYAPLLLFTSFLEAAVYAKVPLHAHVCSEEDKMKKLLEILEVSKKTIIYTENSSIAFEIHNFLKCENVMSYLVSEEMEHYISDGVIQDWKSVRSSASPHCLILTDSVLTSLNISNANMLIHFDVPEISRLQFGNRFSCVAEHFKEMTSPPNCVCHILVSGDCSLQASSLVKLVLRSGVQVPPELEDLAAKKTVKATNAPLCHHLKSLGSCKLPGCQYRHYIDPETDQPNITPREGDLAAIVTHVCDPTHMYVRILKYLSPKLTNLSGTYAKIGFQLKGFFSKEENRTEVKELAVGMMYIYRDDVTGLFYRVKVLSIIPATKTSYKKIKLLFSDEGWVQMLTSWQLYEYVARDTFPQPLVAEVYLCNLRMPDTSLEWNPQATRFVSGLIEGKEIHGKIVLCIGETLWLHPVVQRQKGVKTNDYLTILSVDQTLRNNEYVVQNNNHLKLLLEACKDKISLPKEIKKAEVLEMEKKEEEIQFAYAFLELNKYESVYVSSVSSPQEFYVQRDKFVKCLDELLENIDDKVKNNSLQKCKAFQNGMHCLAPFPENNSYNRAKITEIIPNSEDVQIFYLDFGDFGRVPKDSIYVIPSEFSLLPFQAIKCELNGICAPHGGWTDKAGNTFQDLTRNEEDDMIVLQMMAYKKSRYGNSNHYVVDLWNGDQSISEQLLSAGLVEPAEKCMLPPPQRDESNKDMFDEDLETYSQGSPDDNDMTEEDKAIHAKFLAELAKKMFVEPEPSSQPDHDEVEDRVEEITDKKDKINDKKFEVIDIDPCAQRSPFQATERILKCKRNEPKRAKPFIKWWNTNEHVHILITLRNIEIYELDICDDKFIFSTSLRGMDYHTAEEFYASVDSSDPVTKNCPEGVWFTLKKQAPGEWPRLTKEKFSHIKYDVNHIDDSGSEEEGLPEVPPCISENPDDSVAAHYDSDDNKSSEEEDDDYIQPWRKLAQFKDPFDPLD